MKLSIEAAMMGSSGQNDGALRRGWALYGLLLLAAIRATDPTPTHAGEAADGGGSPAVSASVPFCEPNSRKMNYLDTADGHLVELLGRVFRTCHGVKGLRRAFLISANPDALPGLRFPYTLLTLDVASPFSPAVPSGEWSAYIRHRMRIPEGGRIERRADRVIGDVVYEQYLRYGFIPDGTLIPASVYFIPAGGSDAPDHIFECRGPAVGLRGDASHCSMWLRYKGLNAHIWFRHTKNAFPDPIPVEQFDAYARDVLYVLTATDVTDRVGEFGHLDYTVMDLGGFAPPARE